MATQYTEFNKPALTSINLDSIISQVLNANPSITLIVYIPDNEDKSNFRLPFGKDLAFFVRGGLGLLDSIRTEIFGKCPPMSITVDRESTFSTICRQTTDLSQKMKDNCVSYTLKSQPNTTINRKQDRETPVKPDITQKVIDTSVLRTLR